MRINIIAPRYLTDQHLIAEYNEMLMATKSLERNQNVNSIIPDKFCLGTGHINFFKNKITYLKIRHEQLKTEMRKRGFAARHSIHSEIFPDKFMNDWKPNQEDKKVIVKRIYSRILMKPDWYRYHGKKYDKFFYLELLFKAIHNNRA